MKLLKTVGVTVALGLSLGVAQAEYLPYIPRTGILFLKNFKK